MLCTIACPCETIYSYPETSPRLPYRAFHNPNLAASTSQTSSLQLKILALKQQLRWPFSQGQTFQIVYSAKKAESENIFEPRETERAEYNGKGNTTNNHFAYKQWKSNSLEQLNLLVFELFGRIFVLFFFFFKSSIWSEFLVQTQEWRRNIRKVKIRKKGMAFPLPLWLAVGPFVSSRRKKRAILSKTCNSAQQLSFSSSFFSTFLGWKAQSSDRRNKNRLHCLFLAAPPAYKDPGAC